MYLFPQLLLQGVKEKRRHYYHHLSLTVEDRMVAAAFPVCQEESCSCCKHTLPALLKIWKWSQLNTGQGRQAPEVQLTKCFPSPIPEVSKGIQRELLSWAAIIASLCLCNSTLASQMKVFLCTGRELSGYMDDVSVFKVSPVNRTFYLVGQSKNWTLNG
jgi:hypothetical protein